jgi:hypothetical protein
VAGPRVAVAVAPEAAGPVGTGGRWVWLVAVAAFFLMGAGWALALPINGTYDESQHLVRAYGAASGQLYSTPTSAIRGGGAWFDVPRSLLPGNIDCTWQGKVAASCQRPAPDDRSRVRVGSAAGRYNPVYYAIVGLPLVVAPNFHGVVAARLLSALGAALMLGFATFIAVRQRRPLLVAGVIVVATPMVLNLSGSVNPNGWEIAAGVLLWTTLLTLLRARPDELDHRFTRLLVILSGVAGALLLVLRALGPGLLALIVVGCLLLGRRAALVALLRRRDARWTLGACALVACYAVGWMALSGVANSDGSLPTTDSTTLGLASELRFLALTRLSFWANQIVGQFSYGETTLPSWTIITWYLLVGALVGPALAVVRRLHALVLLGILAVSFGSLLALELRYLHSIGWSQHGRYIMPFGVGLVLGAVFLHRYERAIGDDGVRRLVPGVAIVAGFIHLWALLLVQTRFQFGLGRGLNPLGGSWKPPLGSLTPVFTELVGVAVLAALAWWVTRRVGGGGASTPVTVGAPAVAPAPAVVEDEGGSVADQVTVAK